MRAVTDDAVGAAGAMIGSAVTLQGLTRAADLVGSVLGLVLVVLSIGLVVHRRRLARMELNRARRAEDAEMGRGGLERQMKEGNDG